MAVGTERRTVEQRLHLLRPVLVAIVARTWVVRAQLQQEGGEAEAQVRIAIDGELLAVDVGVGVGDGVHQTPRSLASSSGISLR